MLNLKVSMSASVLLWRAFDLQENNLSLHPSYVCLIWSFFRLLKLKCSLDWLFHVQWTDPGIGSYNELSVTKSNTILGTRCFETNIAMHWRQCKSDTIVIFEISFHQFILPETTCVSKETYACMQSSLKRLWCVENWRISDIKAQGCKSLVLAFCYLWVL